jgi:hypothetical protein
MAKADELGEMIDARIADPGDWRSDMLARGRSSARQIQPRALSIQLRAFR